MATDFDLTVIKVTHNALRRDLRHLADAAEKLRPEDARSRSAVRLGWTTLKSMLTSHHVGEDRYMWPRMRSGLRSRADDLAVLDAMEEEHARVDPLVARVETALTRMNGDSSALASAVQEFNEEVGHHLTHEEEEALPLVRAAMPAREWDKCLADMRGNGLAALKSAPEFFPWLLSEADPADRAAILGKVPPPLKVLYQKVWLPRYTKQPRWM